MKPILFSTPMVQAILEKRKIMTRRVINPQPLSGVRLSVLVRSGLEDGHGRELKPKYLPGDILWVRETWAKYTDFADKSLVIPDGFIYKATGEYHMGMKWRPSIFMPKEAARIFLRVTDVRAERVQDISEADAKAEGFDGVPCDHPNGRYACEDCMNTGWSEPPSVGFMEIWERLDAKRGYGWNANPWVWVYRFERCEKPIDAPLCAITNN